MRIILIILVVWLLVFVVIPWLKVRFSDDPELERQKQVLKRKRGVLTDLKNTAKEADAVAKMQEDEDELRKKVKQVISDTVPNENDPKEG
jgi:type II secretory pathway component PulM